MPKTRTKTKRTVRVGDTIVVETTTMKMKMPAIAAGYVGLISVLCFPAPFALLLGILALRQLKKKPKLHGKGRAIFAIVMGVLFSIPIPFIVIALLSAK